MTKQRTTVEFGEGEKRFRAHMEQSSIHFDLCDIPGALDCLLDLLGGRGVDVLGMVHDLLLTRASKRFRTQGLAATFLGMSNRRISYHLHDRKAGEVMKLLESAVSWDAAQPEESSEE